MKIIIDTNIFCEDFRLRGSNFRVFLDGLNSLPGTLAIPAVVIDETVNRYGERLRALATTDEETRASLMRLIPELGQASNLNVDVATEIRKYRAMIEAVIKEHGIILPYPEIPHEMIVRRDLARKKPFKRDGSGYRDALIWESVKSQMLWGTERVAFVTNNPKDFGDGPLVDPILQSELRRPEHLKLYRSLREFNEIFITPRLQMIKGLEAESFGGSSDGFDLAGWLRTNLTDILRNDDSTGWLITGFPHGVSHIRPVELVAFHNLQIRDARQLDSGERLVRIAISAEFEFSIDVDWDDYMRHEEVRKWAVGSDEFTLASSHTVENIEVTLELILDPKTHKVNSHDLVSLETSSGRGIEYGKG